jgi:hypothetical protein
VNVSLIKGQVTGLAPASHRAAMGHDTSRRCALWVSAGVLAAAEELAEFTGVDVDTFVAMVILELRDQESAEGRLQARAAERPSSSGHVIPMAVDRAQRGRRSQARLE